MDPLKLFSAFMAFVIWLFGLVQFKGVCMALWLFLSPPILYFVCLWAAMLGVFAWLSLTHPVSDK